MISLYDILEAANGQLFGEPAAQIFTDFCLDAQRASESQLYVALKTDHGDGHQFIHEALEHGASGVLCTHPPDFDTEGVSIILVKDTLTALMAWAQYVINKLSLHVIGVAGSSGKSTTIQTVHRVLGTKYVVHSGETSGEGRLSLPLALSRVSQEHQFVLMELGPEKPGEMLEMVQAARPESGIILQIGHSRIDCFNTPEQIAQEHGLLLEYLSPTGLAVLNYDDDRVREMAGRSRAEVATVGLERFGADLMAYNIVLGTSRTGFDLRFGSNRYVGRWTPLLGKHQLYPVLAALTTGLHYGVALDDGLRALTDLPPLPGRMNPFSGLDGCLVIDDSHSANPESTLAALDWLQAIKGENQRVIFVMGDMDHLGTYSQRGHRAVGQRAAEFVDFMISEGKEASLAARAALDQGMDRKQVQITYSLQDAVSRLRETVSLTANDIVLVKGDPSIRMELIVKELLADPQDTLLLPRQEIQWELETSSNPLRSSWVEINVEALASNVRAIKNLIGPEVTLMAVVKADAYGHGVVTAARTALLNGAEYLAVASMYEALELRDAGIEAPILVMSYTPVQSIQQAVRQDITVTLYDLELARGYDRGAREAGGRLRVHVKIDTGMGRLGIPAKEAMAFFRHVPSLEHLDIEGIYTHFSAADESADYTAKQVKTFKNVVAPLKASGIRFKYIHAANSAGTLASKDNHFNMVRTGIAMYGLSPSETVPVPPEFQPVLTWKTVIAQVKTLPAGHNVGYGNTYMTKTEEIIAVIPVGYADGFRRTPQNWGEVLVRGQIAPIAGRVAMEKTMINVSAIPDVAVGDEVVLIGRQGDKVITADDVAAQLGTNNYEVVCAISSRIPRI